MKFVTTQFSAPSPPPNHSASDADSDDETAVAELVIEISSGRAIRCMLRRQGLICVASQIDSPAMGRENRIPDYYLG